MNTWIRRTLQVGLLSAGFVVAASVAAHADTNLISSGNSGILTGNQAVVPIQVPINVCGNGVGVLGLGVGSGTCDATATMKRSGDVNMISSGNSGIGNGNQLYAPIQVPINVCGNGVGVLGGGIGSGTCSATAKSGPHHGSSAAKKSGSSLKGATANGAGDVTLISTDNSGILVGNQAYVPIQVPVNVCGNGVGVLGAGIGSGTCSATATMKRSAVRKSATTLVSTDNSGSLVGNQAYVPIQVPVNVVGNGVGVLGVGVGSGTGTATATMR